MKIITWNCNMAFRKKWSKILDYNPDILVIQECENPDKLQLDKLFPKPYQHIWYGDNPNKGIGFFSYNKNFNLDLYHKHNPGRRPDFRDIEPAKSWCHAQVPLEFR